MVVVAANVACTPALASLSCLFGLFKDNRFFPKIGERWKQSVHHVLYDLTALSMLHDKCALYCLSRFACFEPDPALPCMTAAGHISEANCRFDIEQSLVHAVFAYRGRVCGFDQLSGSAVVQHAHAA